MEKSAIADSSKLKNNLIFTAIFYNSIAITIFCFGAVRWFHFPYLLFLDEWHFLWLMVASCCGLILSLFILDAINIENLSRCLTSNYQESSASQLKILLSSAIVGISGIMILELIMVLWGISSALRGLVNLGLGLSWLWSSRFYWVAVFQNH